MLNDAQLVRQSDKGFSDKGVPLFSEFSKINIVI